MRKYIIVQAQPLPQKTSIAEMHNFDDSYWIGRIFYYIDLCSKNLNYERAKIKIAKELDKDTSKIEVLLKKFIIRWLKMNEDFKYSDGFEINSEPESDGKKMGFYDIKISQSFWNNYFPFECKNLGNISSLTLSKSLKEYTLNSSKNDGGMYRYFIKKYSPNQNYGAMMGFVLSDSETIKSCLIKRIEEVFDQNSFGQLVKEKIIHNPIPEINNIFETIHKRDSEIFYLYHTLFFFESSDRYLNSKIIC